MCKAVFVIDMQNICVGDNHHKFFKYNKESLIDSVNKVIRENEGNTIIYIKTIMNNNFINKFAPIKAYDGNPNVELVKSLEVVSDYVFKKFKGNALTDKKLKEKLDELGVNEIEIVGLDGGGCVALTAFGALKAGYRVKINTNAVGTMFHKRADRFNRKLKMLGAEFI